ncbi:MAG: hypothetical protein LBB88_02625 [Planctomycetaceae bacterium]|jgi:hypothetical protein|nr:hypothetical protein [Planctomycetaceae bacterium]
MKINSTVIFALLLISFFVTINVVVAGDPRIDFEVGSIFDAEKVGKQMRSKWSKLDKLPSSFLNESGIRQLDGKYITLYTDIASGNDVDQLPKIFDLLVIELCKYFGVELNKYDGFHVRGFLIDDLTKFNKHGTLKDAADLRYGYSLRNQIWVRRQNSEYYQRHLFLHEGVHAFMFYAFGTFTPFWYREGIAEMLATHKFENNKLIIGWFPTDIKSVSHLGRIEIMQKFINNQAQNTGRGTVDISNLNYLFSLGKNTDNQVELYAMCWCFTMFCEYHPRYRNAFRCLVFRLSESNTDFARRFIMLVAQENKIDILTAQIQLEIDWNDFKKNICYNYDFERTAIDFRLPINNVTKNPSTKNNVNSFPDIIVQADRGWQNSGIKLESGRRYNLVASGRFQLADKPNIWQSEPGGITIRYYQNMPIGKLIAMIIPEPIQSNANPNPNQNPNQNIQFDVNRNFLSPEYKEIGIGVTWQPTQTGILFLKINDAANSRSDNKGTVTVKIK